MPYVLANERLPLSPKSNHEPIPHGTEFGRLTTCSEPYRRKNDRSLYYDCTCECGVTTSVRAKHLRHDHTTSCGCKAVDAARKGAQAATKHGLWGNPLYRLWRNILRRCYNPKHLTYQRYGGRGIEVCPEWRDSPVGFVAWAEQAGYQSGLEIDRKDADGPYAPENCRFISRKENSRNKRSNHFLTVGGVTRCVTDWAEVVRIDARVICRRLKAGASPEEALARQ